MFFRKCLILLFVFALFGCEDESVEDRACVNELHVLKEKLAKIDTFAYPLYKKNSDRLFALSWFMGYYFAYKKYDETFSLDDDLTIVSGGDGFYIYSKTKNGKKKIWSGECEVYKFVSEEQIRVLDSLENEVRKDFNEKPVKGEWNYSFFNWKGLENNSRWDWLENRFEYVKNSHFEWRESENHFYQYLKKLFERGCKKRVEEIRQKEKSNISASP
ncbi:hypothetical protein IKZ77_03495 [Candidatus Saccharibacteria bacterium]|nr:hypothetical protein [Candidatus Saccharibacteria bacterium]